MPPGQVAAAPLFDRMAACLFDLAIAAVLGGAASKVAALALAEAGLGEAVCELIRKLLLLTIYAVLCVVPAARPAGASWGQRWMGLEVAGGTGGRLSLGQSFGRWLAFLAAALPLGAGLLLALGPARRPWQDRVCDSRVVRVTGGAGEVGA